MTRTPLQRSFFQKTFLAERSPNSRNCREMVQSSASAILLGDAQRVLRFLTESPSTMRWFDVNEVCAERGRSYEEFKETLLNLLD